MAVTHSFFDWFLFYGLRGLGGWFIFLMVSCAAVIWLYYDSAVRRLPAIGWRLGAILGLILVLPSALYRFTITNVADVTSSPLGQFGEIIFYLGILGGVLSVVIAIGYFFAFQGLAVCPQGHLYELKKGNCPHADHNPEKPEKKTDTYTHKKEASEPTLAPALPSKRHLNAWLVPSDNHKNYQLYEGETKIGRSTRNDIVLDGDTTISRDSAKIVEKNGRFRLVSLTQSKFPRLNNSAVHQAVLLENNDEIQFGESTTLRFISSR